MQSQARRESTINYEAETQGLPEPDVGALPGSWPPFIVDPFLCLHAHARSQERRRESTSLHSIHGSMISPTAAHRERAFLTNTTHAAPMSSDDDDASLRVLPKRDRSRDGDDYKVSTPLR